MRAFGVVILTCSNPARKVRSRRWMLSLLMALANVFPSRVVSTISLVTRNLREVERNKKILV